jgi:RNA polymerase sigma-70 factor (ECF subfamily)
MDERELIRRAQGGDQAAFAALVERYAGFLLSLTRCYVGARDGPDAAQEIWVSVFQKLWQLEDGDAFRPWLRKVAYYHCLNHRKARSRRLDRELSISLTDLLRLGEFVADRTADMEALMERADLRRIVSRALDELPGDYGLILRLRFMRELSLAGIVRLTGLSLPTVKWRLHEGKRLLRAKLATAIFGRERN